MDSLEGIEESKRSTNEEMKKKYLHCSQEHIFLRS